MTTGQDKPSPPSATTDFGYQQVPAAEKASRVRAVFESVAGNYDLMNDLMSGGAHRLWKQFALSQTGLRPGQRALDVAGGTGDLAGGMAKQVGAAGLVMLTDINAAMLSEGRDALVDRGVVANVRYAIADAERLPFPDASFDCVTIGFGLRNVTDKMAALQSMARVLKTGRTTADSRVFASRGARTEADLRRLFVHGVAVARQGRRQRRRQLPLSR